MQSDSENHNILRIFNEPNYFLKHYLPTPEVLNILNSNETKIENPE